MPGLFDPKDISKEINRQLRLQNRILIMVSTGYQAELYRAPHCGQLLIESDALLRWHPSISIAMHQQHRLRQGPGLQ